MQPNPPAPVTLDDAIAEALDTGLPVPMHEGSPALHAFISEVGEKIYGGEDLKRRYGLSTEELMRLIARPAIRERIRERRAIWQSSASAEERLRAYSSIVAQEAIPVLDQFIHDNTLPATVRLDALREAMKGAGVGQRKEQAQGGGGGGGLGGVSIQIILGDQTAKFSTVELPVVDVSTVVDVSPEDDAA